MNDSAGIGDAAPLLTVGVPIYNEEACIRECLDCLLEQTRKDFRIIVSDNASTDGTVAIVREYASRHSQIQLIEQAENLGVFANWRAVLDAAESKYFIWRAGDDLSNPDYIEQLLDALAEQPQAKVAVPHVRVHHPGGGKERYFPPMLAGNWHSDLQAILDGGLYGVLFGAFETEYLKAIMMKVARLYPDMWAGDRLIHMIVALDVAAVPCKGGGTQLDLRFDVRPSSVPSPDKRGNLKYPDFVSRIRGAMYLKAKSDQLRRAAKSILRDYELPPAKLTFAKQVLEDYLKQSLPVSLSLWREMVKILLLGRHHTKKKAEVGPDPSVSGKH